jgi:hypothetical protein
MLLLKQEYEVADIKFLISFEKLEDDQCWEWEGYFSKNLPALYVNGKQGQATHYSWKYFRGEKVPAGFMLKQTCKNKSCVNYHHLEAVQRGEHLKNPRKPKMITVTTNNPEIVITQAGQLELTDRGYRRVKSLTRTKTVKEVSKKFGIDARVVKAIRDSRPYKHLKLVG